MKIDEHFFDAKTVLVFGFGSNGGGLGTVEFLLSTGVKKLIVTDQRTEADLQHILAKLPPDTRLQWSLGGHSESDFLEADVVIKNPVIKWDHPLLVQSRKNGAEIMMDSTVFMTLCSVPVLGVTGSKGKTSTATLLSHILTTAGHSVIEVGVSQTGVLSELLKITPDSVVVFELSSWRLSGLTLVEKSPHISIITNLYPDHLNYYGNMEAYANDKKIITEFQSTNDFLVVPQRSQWTDFFMKSTQASTKTFGKDDSCCAWQDEKSLWCWWTEGDDNPTLLIKKEESLLQGEHLFENMLAATLAAKAFGVGEEALKKALLTFKGVPHRFELVREVSGVRYINDTTATIPAAALASAQSLTTSVVLLAGGSDKGLPLDDLVTAINLSRHTILFEGSGTDILVPLLEEKGIHHYEIAKSMSEAVTQAKAAASKGDTVLLAPGAASFGMFINEFDRAEQFIKEVNKL